MALRLKADNAYGKFAGISTSATTLTSDELPRLPAVSAPDVIAVTLDWNRRHGEPEIVHVTDYDGVGNTATIERGKEGTTARTHPGSPAPDWVHGFTVLDEGLLAHSDGTPTPGGLLQVKSLDPFIVEHLPSDTFVNDGGGVPSFTADTRANQPAAGTPGRLFHVTDEDVIERDNGTSWVQVRDLAHRNNTANPHSVTHSQVGAPTDNPHAVTASQAGAVENAGSTPSILADTRANQPAAGSAGRLYVVTDELVIERDNGTEWEQVSGAGVVAWESVMDHGAVGDGVADDSAAIQAAVDAVVAAGGGVVYFPPGRYRVTDDAANSIAAVSIGGDNVHLLLDEGAVIDADEIGYRTIEASGSMGTPVSLNADAAVYDTSVSVTSGDEANFAVGDYVMVQSDVYVGRTNQPASGEFHLVVGTADGRVDLGDPLWHPHATVNNAAVVKFNPLESITIEGGKIDGGTGMRGIYIERCNNVRLRGINIHGFGNSSTSVGINKSTNVRISDCHWRDAGNYALVLVNGPHWVTITGNTFVNCPDGYDQGGASSDYGITRFVTITGNTFIGAPVSTHSSAQFMIVDSNFVVARSTGSAAMFFRGGDITVSNNTIRGTANNAIYFRVEYDYDCFIVVDGNDVECVGDASGLVVDYGGDTSNGGIVKQSIISNNKFRLRQVGSTTSLVLFRSSASRGFSGLTVNGNDIWGQDGPTAIYFDNGNGATFEHVIATGNKCKPKATASTGQGIRVGGAITDSWIDGNLLFGGTPLATGTSDAANFGTNREITE